MGDNSLSLNVKGARHVLRPGIVLLGSTESGRYRTILVDDKSICPKHACIRYDPATSDLQVMDLCSVGGVTVDQRPINALTWCKINRFSQLLVGTVPVSFGGKVPGHGVADGSVATKEDLSFLLDEDSNDFIDCSLEESKQLPGRKPGLLSGSHGASKDDITLPTSRKSLEEDRTDRATSSFLVPATQQLEDSALSTVANESLPYVKPCVVKLASVDTKPVPEEATAPPVAVEECEDDDEDFFIIPETQQPCENEMCGPSPIIESIGPSALLGPERTERTQTEEEYFQLTIQDEENSNDGLFNNMYVEGSQNLLQNMDESYKRVGAAAGTRRSILPERSVDSISFQEHRNTTQDMSRLEWNETRQGHEPSLDGKFPASPVKRKEAAEQHTLPAAEQDDRSITPELHFDQPGMVEERQREGSVTPEVDFDKLLGEANAEPEPPPERPPPVEGVNLDDNEHEISLNQEGCNEQPIEEVPEADGSKRVEDIYDIETQALDFDQEDVLAERDDSRMVPTAALVPASASASPYDMETQVLDFDVDNRSIGVADPYDLLTQPMEPPTGSFIMGPPKTPQPKSVPRRNKQPSPVAVPVPDEFLTQPMIPPDSLRNSFAKVKATDPQPSTSYYRSALNPVEMETEPMSPPGRTSGRDASSPFIDPADLLTQPMSPPKYLQEDRFKAWKTPASRSFDDAYDQPTQPLHRSPATLGTAERGRDNIDASLASKKLFVKMMDIKHGRSLQDYSDPYALQTQPLASDGDENGNAYDQRTQPLAKMDSLTRGTIAAEATSLEISRFDPQINSTVRYSQPGGPKQHHRKDGLEISPSSNKENNTDPRHGRESSSEEDLDDEVCLAATMPIDELQQKEPQRPDARGSGRTRKASPSVFKVPSVETGELLITPKPTARGRSVELTEFLTPEHPLLSLPKPDRILMASGHMRELAASHSRSVKGCSKYHFNDSSSGSDDNEDDDRQVFRKTNVSVALERELERMQAVSKERKMNAAEQKVEKAESGKRPVKKDEPVNKEKEMEDGRSENAGSERRSHEKGSSTGSSRLVKHNEAPEAAQGSSRREKTKKDEGKDKESSRDKEEKRKEGATSNSYNATNRTESDAKRVFTRSGREVRPKHQYDTSESDSERVVRRSGRDVRPKQPTVGSKTDAKRVVTRSGREVRSKHPIDTSESDSEHSVTRSGRAVRPKQSTDGSESDSKRVVTRSGREVRPKQSTDGSESDSNRVFTRSGREVRPKHQYDTSESDSERVVRPSGRDVRPKQSTDGSESDSKRVVTRSGREVRPKQPIDTSEFDSDRVAKRSGRDVRPKQPIDASIDYQAKSNKGITPAATTTAPRTLRPRQASVLWTREEKKLRRGEESAAAAPVGQRRESKRRKSVHYQHRSPTPSGEPPRKKADINERPRRKSTTTKQVDGESCSTTFGMLLVGDSLAPERPNGGLANVSATSSSGAGSDGSVRPARSNRPKLIFTRMSPEPYRKCIARAGGKVVEIPELANVLVTDRIFRTYKFLCAVAKGIPIVGQSYLDALQAANEHDAVDPWKHILCDEATEARYKFRLRDTLLKARTHKLFQDYTVFVTSSTQPPPSELYLILSCAGATPLKHPGQLKGEVRHGDKLFVISDPSDAAKWPMFKEKFPSIEIVSTEGFMLSIMQHSISFKKHRLM